MKKNIKINNIDKTILIALFSFLVISLIVIAIFYGNNSNSQNDISLFSEVNDNESIEVYNDSDEDESQTESYENGGLSISEYKSIIEDYSSIIDEVQYSLNRHKNLKMDTQVIISLNQATNKISSVDAPVQLLNEHNSLSSANDTLIKATNELKNAQNEFDRDIAYSDIESALNGLFEPIQPIANYVE